MSFYDKRILPWLIDLGMRGEDAMRYRQQVVPQAAGVVLEIGVGSGLNLPLYGSGVEQLYALDPSDALISMARKKAIRTEIPVTFLAHSSEDIPLDRASVDVVVMTWTLCSIPDPSRALREMRRVLKPGGALLFAEHGLAPDKSVQRWQHRLNPVWGRFTGGCNLNRPIPDLLEQAGFRSADLQTMYIPGWKPACFNYWGSAEYRR